MNTAKTYIPNIPDNGLTRIVLIGGGFAGIKFLKKMRKKNVQIVLLDKNNFHQFQPLLYQVATAGLEPSSISFPIRKILQKEQNIHFRIAEVQEVMHDEKEIRTNIGYLKFDYLVLAMGADTNYFGQEEIEQNALSMKSASDAIFIRNTILQNFETALLQNSPDEALQYMNIVLVGGGPTGVELAGALAEMKRYIFPKDYPELDISKMRIVLYEASDTLLNGMSKSSSNASRKYLERLGIEIRLNTRVENYNGTFLELSDGSILPSRTVIWAAGIKTPHIKGFSNEVIGSQGRFIVDRYNRILGYKDVFAVGDNAFMTTSKYPSGHPQVAQTAIQQASRLALNLSLILKGKNELKEFEYKDKGSMATIGRNLAVADLPNIKLKGFIAWMLWSFVHLFTIFGLKNKIITFLNWMWSYWSYDQSLRVLIRPKFSNKSSIEYKEEHKREKVGSTS